VHSTVQADCSLRSQDFRNKVHRCIPKLPLHAAMMAVLGVLRPGPYSSGMRFIVLCGRAKNPPDLVVGPFETTEDANDWLTAHKPQPDRYAVPMPLTAPQDS